MKKQDTTKLRLDRETLAPLQAQDLDAVAGGIIVPPPISPATYTIGKYLLSKLGRCGNS